MKTLEEGKKLSSDLIASGQAREKFREIVGLQGGDVWESWTIRTAWRTHGRLSISPSFPPADTLRLSSVNSPRRGLRGAGQAAGK